MKFIVEDRAGYTLAEGRLERNRAEALAIVEKIERRLALEKLCRASGDIGPRTGSAAHLMNSRRYEPAPAAIFEIGRTRNPDEPMATRSRYARMVIWAASFLKGGRS